MEKTTSIKTARKLAAAAALGGALALGLSACSPSTVHGQRATPASAKRAKRAAVAPAKEADPGGTERPASPAERKKALSSFGAYNTMGMWGPKYSFLSHLLASLPPEDLPEVSNNWSGYQVISARTGRAATSASGSWVVPKVSAPNRGEDGFSSIWVGIGGSCLDATCRLADRTLIQLGTAEDASPSGARLYYAWYELLPAASVEIKTLEVSPGDTVTASLSLAGSKKPETRSYNPMTGVRRPGRYNPGNIGWGGGLYNPGNIGQRPGAYESSSTTMTWLLSISVTSPSGAVQHWSKTVAYASSLASAEWVTEGPSAGCNGTIGELPLADYHSVSFSNLEENSRAPSLGLSNLVIAYDPYGELSLPAPSFLLRGKTATYFVPFVPKGSAGATGKASCNPMATVGHLADWGDSWNPMNIGLGGHKLAPAIRAEIEQDRARGEQR